MNHLNTQLEVFKKRAQIVASFAGAAVAFGGVTLVIGLGGGIVAGTVVGLAVGEATGWAEHMSQPAFNHQMWQIASYFVFAGAARGVEWSCRQLGHWPHPRETLQVFRQMWQAASAPPAP